MPKKWQQYTLSLRRPVNRGRALSLRHLRVEQWRMRFL